MNMFKKNGGFTLVELIVVIAILAILASVAVPAYSGYIARANDAACLSELTAIQTAAQAACALEGTSVSSISIAAGADATEDITVTAADATNADEITETFAELYTAPTNLGELLAKHSEYTDNSAVTWSTDDGWDLLADDSGEEG